jgi:hypothetical protein
VGLHREFIGHRQAPRKEMLNPISKPLSMPQSWQTVPKATAKALERRLK